MTGPAFPFSAVVGCDEAKLALLLTTVDPAIGGVLLRGDKGSAKTTLARGLAALSDGAPFIDLPLGATEERVVGSLDLAAALTGGEVRLQPGLLAAAHHGVLYVDEVNLLADHLVDVLLDVAATGVNRVERDAVSHTHPARFVLIASMNPEEGDLRPQLLDRFGLAVDIRTTTDAALRAEAVRRRLDFDDDPLGFAETWADAERDLAERLRAAAPVALEDDLLQAAAEVAVAAGAEGLRADLVLARAAAAMAGWEGRADAGPADLRVVAPLVLAHRARRHPLDPPGAPPSDLDDVLGNVLGNVLGPQTPQPVDEGGGDPPPSSTGSPPSGHAAGEGEARVDESGPVARVVTLRAPRTQQPSATGRRSPVSTDRGRVVDSVVPTGGAR